MTFCLGQTVRLSVWCPADAAKDKPHEERDEINILALSHLTFLLCSNEVFSLFHCISDLIFSI